MTKANAQCNIIEITVDGIKYTQTRPGYYYKKTEDGHKRIPKSEWEQAFDKYTEISKVDEEWDMGQEIEDRKAEQEKAQAESDKMAEDAMNKCGDGTPLNEVGKQIAAQAKKKAKKAPVKKARRSKDVAFELKENGETVLTLTAKQVDFIKHIPDTCFYENGLESTPWCDVLADEIGGQFAGKPMTVGAMISTLREKNLIYVGMDHINGKKAKYFGFTDLGKQVATGMGLN